VTEQSRSTFSYLQLPRMLELSLIKDFLVVLPVEGTGKKRNGKKETEKRETEKAETEKTETKSE